MKPFVTVAIPTYHRAQRLCQTLEGMTRQDYPADRYEILVIDNNSPDHTAEVVAQFAAAAPAPQRIVETQQGLDYARNRAIAEADGEIIVFADDDILVEPDWLAEMIKPFTAAAAPESGAHRPDLSRAQSRDALSAPPAKQPGRSVGAVGGEVIPVFPDGLPAWVAEWHGPLAFRADAGPIEARHSPMGANLAIRKSVFGEVGVFHTALDRAAGNYFSGGDAEMVRRIRDAGYEIWFAPAAAVRHQMPASRTTFRYARRHAFDSARSRVIDRAGQPGAAAYLASRFFTNLLKASALALLALLWFLLFQTGRAKQALVRSWRSCGYLYQILHSATETIRLAHGYRTPHK